MFTVYFLLLVLPLVSAQITGHGRCPVPTVQPDFNMHKFLGMWYEIARIPSAFSEGTCVTAEYKMGKGNFFTGVHTQRLNGELSSQTGTIKVRQSGEKAKLEIQFSKSQPFRPYWVLKTDYLKYAIAYTCENQGNTHSQYAWIISRKPSLDQKTLHEAKRLLVNQGIYGNKMEDTDQDCDTKTPGKN